MLIDDLSYYMCPGSAPQEAFIDIHQIIYKCWREVWEQTFQELNYQKEFFSDNFTRQDYIGAIFYKQRCVALQFFRWVDARKLDVRTDSYFSNWSDQNLAVLFSRGPKVIVCSQFTVHPEARGNRLGVSGKDLLVGMAIETFMASDSQAMTGAVRVDRGVNSATERWGAFVIERKVPCEFGERNTDLIGLFKDQIQKTPRPELKYLAHQLWNKRVMIPRQDLSHQYTRFNESVADKAV